MLIRHCLDFRAGLHDTPYCNQQGILSLIIVALIFNVMIHLLVQYLDIKV